MIYFLYVNIFSNGTVTVTFWCGLGWIRPFIFMQIRVRDATNRKRQNIKLSRRNKHELHNVLLSQLPYKPVSRIVF
jgi:hypothetical protein